MTSTPLTTSQNDPDTLKKDNSRVSAQLIMMTAIFTLAAALGVAHVSGSGLPYASAIVGANNKFQPPKHAEGVEVVDFASHDLPPVTLGERIVDLMSGTHFDNLLQDTPDELRPPSLVLFTGFKSCNTAVDQTLLAEFRRNAETIFPDRERLLIGVYDMDAAPKRAWYRFTPEMDLQQRFQVTKCNELIFVPRECDGFTQFCTYKDPKIGNDITVAGCKDFKDACKTDIVSRINVAATSDYVQWVQKHIQSEGEPQISPVFKTYTRQGEWIRSRDETTTDNELRNYFLVEAFPAFTKTGYLVMPIPPKLQDWFLDFYRRRNRSGTIESWHAASTQMSFHETPTDFVSLDQEAYMRDKLANEILKPIVADWSGIPDLELASFYGIREYKKKSWLRNHIDRIDTHVLSITFSIGKLDPNNHNRILTPEEEAKHPRWPIEVISFDGLTHRYDHPGGYMLLYESSKLIHGRPYHNQGPAHLGAFCHFKPIISDAAGAAKWEGIARAARRNQQRNSVQGSYRSTRTVEPKFPVFTAVKYGENTGFDGPAAEEAKRPRRGEMEVAFKNKADRPLTVVWLSPNGDRVPQGSIAPNTELRINTFAGHRFAFAESGTLEIVEKGTFEIDAGSREYVYSAKKVNVAQSRL